LLLNQSNGAFNGVYLTTDGRQPNTSQTH